MPLSDQFPTDPYVILDPTIRWYPGDELLLAEARGKLIPPLVDKVRQGVKAWRDSRYAGASDTTQILLRWWFNEEHAVPDPDGTRVPFRWYFAQREAVESAIWLYEVEQAREPYALMTKYDSSRALSRGMFDEDWARYVMKLATGAGKTKVMSLLITWSYFHKLYEAAGATRINTLGKPLAVWKLQYRCAGLPSCQLAACRLIQAREPATDIIVIDISAILDCADAINDLPALIEFKT